MSSEMRALIEAGNKLLAAMEMQEGRESEALHIAQPTAKHLWDEAKTAWSRALLARTEAGADGAVAHIHDYGDRVRVVWDKPWGDFPVGTQFYTHPQDASGDAAKLGAFAASILNLDEDWIGDVDGGTLQDAAEKHGLLQPVEVTESCGENCACAGYGDFPQTCYRPTETMKRAIAAMQAKERQT